MGLGLFIGSIFVRHHSPRLFIADTGLILFYNKVL